MLNECLYEILVDLGVDKDKAKEAARKDKELSEIRGLIFELTRQSAETNTRLISVESDVSALKSDVSTLKSDVSALKSDVSVLKIDVASLKTDVATLKNDVKSLDMRFDSMDTKMDFLVSLVKGLAKLDE